MCHLLSSSFDLELADRTLDIEAFYGAHEDAWYVQDEAKTDEANNDLIRLDLIHTFKQVANFSEPDGRDLYQAQQEGSHWLRELFWIAKHIFHHVDAVPGLGQALPMQDQHGKEEAEVQGCVILVANFELFEKQDGADES